MRGRLSVAVVQTGMFLKDSAKASASAASLVRGAAAAGAEMVCLPEHWLGSKVLEPGNGVYSEFSRLARELGIHLNMGGAYERTEAGVHLVSTTFSPRGDVAGRQEKVHLYRREGTLAAPGRRFEPFEAGGIKVGVLVCHDVVFPESARTLVLRGAEVLLVPSLIVARGAYPWHVYLKARALENRVPVVSANVYSPPQFLGESNVVDLGYDRAERVMELHESVAPAGEMFFKAELDLGYKKRLREERLSERRPAAYEL